MSARAWALLLEYDGGPFVGWQRQRNGTSIQELVEAAAGRLAAGTPTESRIAGRTDAGVHAEGQVALVHLPDPPAAPLRADTVRDAINFHLKPHPIVVLRANPAPPGWDPRFDAILRRYRYRILNRRSRPTLAAGHVWHVERALDVTALAEGAARLLGRHDFTSFRATACQARTPVRTLDRLSVHRDGELVIIEAAARSFLHHQVRNMVGTLALVGAGRWTPDDVGRALEARDRRRAGPTAPPGGLTLVEVGYPSSPFAPSDDA